VAHVAEVDEHEDPPVVARIEEIGVSFELLQIHQIIIGNLVVSDQMAAPVPGSCRALRGVDSVDLGDFLR